MTAVEQFIQQLEQQGDSWENVSMGTINISINVDDYLKLKNQAKEMEKKEKLKHQLFIGKVSDIIGFDKTLELLRECNNTIKC